jgi:hypothetical protein
MRTLNSARVKTRAVGTTRDRDLWNKLVNSQFGSEQPVLSEQESIAAARKLYRHAMGVSFPGKIVITSGRRYTWVRRGVLSVNPDHRGGGPRGLRAMIHDLSHYCHSRLHPNDAPHSKRQAQLEGKLVRFALSRGFTQGALKREPAPAKPKPSLVQQRYTRMLNRRDKWAAELKRAQRLLAKANREVRDYERRHAEKLAA